MGKEPRISSAHIPKLAGSPQIAVIIPTFGHPVLLSEAIESVLAQRSEFLAAIIIVSDGCRLNETDTIASAYAVGHPNIVYLRKKNGGPGSARNYGIEYSLSRWPKMEAAFFLDADNRLSTTALQDAFSALKMNPGVGWIYPNIDSFGITWSANFGAVYSPLLHIAYDNICDTGSLVARSVLESGVRFDEDSRSGYEDWDFWLQCLDRGFVGKHAPFGFSYRQRPESRFREMNRQRGAMVEHLRKRHWSIADPRNLLRWEHATNPRYLFRSADGKGAYAFTDPCERGKSRSISSIVEQFYAAQLHPDEYLCWPFFVFGTNSILDNLERLRLSQGVFALMEREAKRVDFAVLTFDFEVEKLAVDIGRPNEAHSIMERAVMWMCRADKIRDMVDSDNASPMEVLAAPNSSEVIIEVRLTLPSGNTGVPKRRSASYALIGMINRLKESPLRRVSRQRWNWRPHHFPAREDYYSHVCKYVGTNSLMPRLSGTRLEIGVVVPIASFGGAEKVAYAMARYLRKASTRVHLFIVGPPLMRIVPEFDGAFDTINFLAEPDYPTWGGPLTVYGQECYSSDNSDIKAPDVAGLLVNLDFVVNCHSAPLNAIMGTLRSQQRAKTATYLHVFDFTKVGRPVGHPYLATAFEHAYDLVLTCSHQLAEQIHALGLPAEKILPINNAAGFSITKKAQSLLHQWRTKPRGDRKLRLIYIGRLDRQKGVERLLISIRHLWQWGSPVEIRVIGGGLVDAQDRFWAEALQSLGASIEQPIYSTQGLAEAYGWADVLLLPSRWEGAPLVIAECHQSGCVPIATRVGAVAELLSHGLDGMLVENSTDEIVGEAIATMVAMFADNDLKRIVMSKAGMKRSITNQWDRNFEPLGVWMADAFGSRWASTSAVL